MKVLVLGASGYLGGVLYKRLKEATDYWVLGTYYRSEKQEGLIKLDVSDFIEVKTFLQHLNPDIIIWCLMGKTNEKQLIHEGIFNVLNNINQECKFIFMSTNAVFGEGNGDFSEEDIPFYKSCESAIALYSNAKIDGEKMVREHENYIIIRPGAIYGQGIHGIWDKRVSQLIKDLTTGRTIVKTINLINTFVEVNELSDAIIRLIKINYSGIIHLGPERKENYYDHYRIMARRLKLDDTLILSNYISKKQAIEKGIIIDTSINTRKCREGLGLYFNNFNE